MATTNPSVVSAYVETQDLFSIEQVTTIPAVPDDEGRFPAQDGAVFYVNGGSTATVVFDVTDTEVGTDISLDNVTGVFTLAGNLTYSLGATAEVTSTGAVYQWFNVDTDEYIGFSAGAGNPVQFIYTPDDTANVALAVEATPGTVFTYPAQVQNAQATVEVISGFVA
jgi:hypothetical protein